MRLRSAPLFRLGAGVMVAALAVLATAGAGGPAAASAPYPVPYNFIPAAVTGGVTLTDGPPGANDWNCHPSATHPDPVVLTHGIAGNGNDNWQTYGPLLANNGYCVYSLTYGALSNTLPLSLFGGFTDIEASAAQLSAFVDRVLAATHAAKIDIVGHSEGTVVPDYYAKFLGGADKIDEYVSLAPLWHGTDPGGIASVTAFLTAGAAPPSFGALTEMTVGSPFLARLRSGGTPAVPGISYTNIVTQYDELVQPYTSGIEPGMRNIVVQSQCALDFSEHLEIAADPVASVDVLNALDPAHPRPVPCVLVLPVVGA